MTVIVQKGDITKLKIDAIVNPANSSGYMGGGVAGAIKRVGGVEIEKEAISKAPISVGDAVVTTAGKLPCKYVIHAPTMKQPAMRIGVENVRLATRAAFKKAKELGIKSIAFPGMGTGVGGVPLVDAAKVMVETAKDFEKHFEKIVFIGLNNEFVNVFKKFL